MIDLDVIKSFLIDEWIQVAALALSLLAFFISILAYKKVSKIHSNSKSVNQIANKSKLVEPILELYKSIDVSLMITAKRNAQNDLRLIMKNTGRVTAKGIDIVIGEPIRVIKTEELANGIKEMPEINNSALKPRLTVIDAKMIFPIPELLPGVLFDIIAVTTMGYGKICDFPISINWTDDRGTRHFQDEVVTI